VGIGSSSKRNKKELGEIHPDEKEGKYILQR
jgi:hypothetical protein